MNTAIRQKGFTLIELTVALAIFAVLSVMAYQGLDAAQTAKRYTEQRMQSLKALQMTWVILQKDLEQMIDRPIRDELGNSIPALNQDFDNLIEFTKTGERNITPGYRGALKRIAYRLQDDTLMRLQWAVLDRASLENPVTYPLLKDVENVRFRYLHSDGQWHEQWPPGTHSTFGQQAPEPMPQAIEITLKTKQWGEIKRLFPGIQAFVHVTP